MATPFVEDTRVEPRGAGHWAAILTDRWDIGVPNGGYVLCVALSAVRAELGPSHPHPLSVSAHYLGSCEQGPAVVDVTVLKRGRSLSTAYAALSQA